jgi:hypothetical protein
VTTLIGKPDACDDVMGVRNCVWGDEKRSVQVGFVADKVLLFFFEQSEMNQSIR